MVVDLVSMNEAQLYITTVMFINNAILSQYFIQIIFKLPVIIALAKTIVVIRKWWHLIRSGRCVLL